MVCRNVRRVHARTMDKIRLSGAWPPWRRKPVAPGEIGAHGWTRDVHAIDENGVYAVLHRVVETDLGPVEHAAVRSVTGGADIPWKDKQRIKDELFGPGRVAVEVFPPTAELVDDVNMYHLWVLPHGFRLPFPILDR